MTKKVLISLEDIENMCNGLKLELLSRDANADLILKITATIDSISSVYRKWFDAQPEASQWISVDNELPPLGALVFLRGLTHNPNASLLRLNESYSIAYRYEEGYSSCGKWVQMQVTHWMPIPPLSKMETTGEENDN